MTRNEYNAKAAAFLADIVEVCRKHGFSVSHEDGHGAFKVEPFNESDSEWLSEASVERPKRPLFPLAAAADVTGGREALVVGLWLNLLGQASIERLAMAAKLGAMECARAFDGDTCESALDACYVEPDPEIRTAFHHGWEEQAKSQAGEDDRKMTTEDTPLATSLPAEELLALAAVFGLPFSSDDPVGQARAMIAGAKAESLDAEADDATNDDGAEEYAMRLYPLNQTLRIAFCVGWNANLEARDPDAFAT